MLLYSLSLTTIYMATDINGVMLEVLTTRMIPNTTTKLTHLCIWKQDFLLIHSHSTTATPEFTGSEFSTSNLSTVMTSFIFLTNLSPTALTPSPLSALRSPPGPAAPARPGGHPGSSCDPPGRSPERIDRPPPNRRRISEDLGWDGELQIKGCVVC